MLGHIAEVIQPFIHWVDQTSEMRAEDLTYTPLKGGLSKASLFRFEYNGISYVLRLFPFLTPECTRCHIVDLAVEAGAIGAGPKVCFVDHQMNGLVMEYIPGRMSEVQDFHEPEKLEAFAKFLHGLHHSQSKFPTATTPFERFNQFVEVGKCQEICYPERFDEAKNLMQELAGILSQLPISLVPSHLDLHTRNIMISDRGFTLVDWVNGGLSDPFHDLATFTTFHSLNPQQIEHFLMSYFMRPLTPYERHRFVVTEPIRLLVVAAVFLTFYSDPTADSTYENALQKGPLPSLEEFGHLHTRWTFWQFGLSFFKTALTKIDSEPFKTALSVLQKARY